MGKLRKVRLRKLALLVAARLMYRLQNKKPIHLLHIGKTGGTAIKYALRPFQATGHFEIRLRPHQTRLCDIPRGHGIIFFLRDPITRFVSGFYSRQRQGLPKHFSAWTPEEKVAFETFHTANELAVSLSSSDIVLKEKAQKAMRSIGHIRSPYRLWLRDESYLALRLSDIFFIGFQESLAQDFLALSAKLGLPEEAMLPSDDVKAHKTPASIDKSLDDEAIANLNRWYETDYRFIELCQELKPSVNAIKTSNRAHMVDDPAATQIIIKSNQR